MLPFFPIPFFPDPVFAQRHLPPIPSAPIVFFPCPVVLDLYGKGLNTSALPTFFMSQ